MSNYRIARLAFPPELSKSEADDIIATANELGDGRWSARQSFGLATYGMRTRNRLATDGRRGRAWAQGIGFGLVTLFMAQGLMWSLHASGLATLPYGPTGLTEWIIPFFSPILTLVVLLRSTRTWALLTVAVIEVGPLAAILAIDGLGPFGTPESRFPAAFALALTVGLFLLHRYGDGRPAASGTLVAIAAIAVAVPAVLADNATLSSTIILALVVVGLVAIRVDPRWAIGAATVVLYNLAGMLALGVTDIFSLGLVVIAFAVLIIADRSAIRIRTA